MDGPAGGGFKSNVNPGHQPSANHLDNLLDMGNEEAPHSFRVNPNDQQQQQQDINDLLGGVGNPS